MFASALVAATLLAGCGSAGEAQQVRAASGAATTSTTESPAAATAVSPVDGFTADELRSALLAPSSASVRSAPGPTAERVSTGNGSTVWRVRVPGQFPVRSARVAISVGGRVVGEGVLALDLHSIATITTDATGLRSGARVSYRWEGSTPVAAGTLVVVR